MQTHGSTTNDDRDEEDCDRIDHGAANLSGELDLLLDVERETVENRIEDTAHLTGAYEVDK